MPYLGASFDDATQAALAEAADRFAANSPFERDQTRPFHIPLIGGLHVYTRDEISNAVEAGSQAASDAIEGRFVRWEASPRGRLRVVVSLKSHDGLERIRWLLPRGKEWRDEKYVDVGSLSEVSRSERDAFLEAAAAAFPITESSCFACRALDYVELPKKPPASRGKHRAKLAESVARIVIKEDAMAISLDDLIKERKAKGGLKKPAPSNGSQLNPDAATFVPGAAAKLPRATTPSGRNRAVRPGALVTAGPLGPPAIRRQHARRQQPTAPMERVGKGPMSGGPIRKNRANGMQRASGAALIRP